MVSSLGDPYRPSGAPAQALPIGAFERAKADGRKGKNAQTEPDHGRHPKRQSRAIRCGPKNGEMNKRGGHAQRGRQLSDKPPHHSNISVPNATRFQPHQHESQGHIACGGGCQRNGQCAIGFEKHERQGNIDADTNRAIDHGGACIGAGKK